MSFPAKRRRCIIDRAYTLLGFLSAESARVKTDTIEGGANMDVLQYKLTSLEFVPPDKLISHTFLTSSREIE